MCVPVVIWIYISLLMLLESFIHLITATRTLELEAELAHSTTQHYHLQIIRYWLFDALNLYSVNNLSCCKVFFLFRSKIIF